MLEALVAPFVSLQDPRCEWRVEHKLVDILVIAVCVVLGEAASFEDIALYGRCKRDWLQCFLELPGGIPSHDTLRRVLMLIDPERFERCFLGWVQSVFRPTTGTTRQIAIDGKTVRRSFDRKRGRSPLHLVSAYATEHGIVLAQRATKTNDHGILAVEPTLGADDGACPGADELVPAQPGHPGTVGLDDGDPSQDRGDRGPPDLVWDTFDLEASPERAGIGSQDEPAVVPVCDAVDARRRDVWWGGRCHR